MESCQKKNIYNFFSHNGCTDFSTVEMKFEFSTGRFFLNSGQNSISPQRLVHFFPYLFFAVHVILVNTTKTLHLGLEPSTHRTLVLTVLQGSRDEPGFHMWVFLFKAQKLVKTITGITKQSMIISASSTRWFSNRRSEVMISLIIWTQATSRQRHIAHKHLGTYLSSGLLLILTRSTTPCRQPCVETGQTPQQTGKWRREMWETKENERRVWRRVVGEVSEPELLVVCNEGVFQRVLEKFQNIRSLFAIILIRSQLPSPATTRGPRASEDAYRLVCEGDIAGYEDMASKGSCGPNRTVRKRILTVLKCHHERPCR